LKDILKKVMIVIRNVEDILEQDYGSLYEGITFMGEAGEVTEDGNI
jgi:hypothetical protein